MNVLKYYSTNCTLTMVQMANFVCILPTAAPLLPTTHAHTYKLEGKQNETLGERI